MKALKLLEPKRQKTFRDKYLAVLFAVAALLISSVVSAQLDSAKYSAINGYGFKYKRMVFDSVLMIPQYISPHTPWRAGAIRYNAPDSTLQLWTGYQWNSILTGIGNGVDTAYMINDTLLLIETPDQNFMLAIPGRPRVDSIYRKEGQDSIFYLKNGVEYALKDSTDGSGGGAHSWQQTLDVGNTTSTTLHYDTTMVGNPVEKLWAKYEPLVKTDTATTPFYQWQFSGLNNGSYNEVMMWGWNINAGGGSIDITKPSLGESWESNYQINPLYPAVSDRLIEKHEFCNFPAGIGSGLQHRISSYTINSSLGTINYYHTLDAFSLHNVATHTPFYSILGVSNYTAQSWINSANQSEYFDVNAQFNQDVNISSLTIGSSTSKPVSLFNLANFNNASFPSSSFTGLGYNGAEIGFNGTGALGRILFDSVQGKIETYNDNPISVVNNGVSTLGIYKTKMKTSVPLAINNPTFSSTPFAALESSANSSSLEAAGWFQQSSSTASNKYGIEVYANGANGINEGIYVAAANGTNNRSIRIQSPSAAAGNYAIYSDATAQSYFGGKIGLGVGTPTATLHLAAGTTTANTAPLKIDPGTNLTTPEDGAIEYNGTHFYATVGSTRHQLDQQSSSGITSINSQTGPAITLSGQGAIIINNPSANNIGIAVDVTSDLLPRTIDAVITTAQNSGTTETDLFTKTISGGTLNTDKQTLNFEIDGEFNDNTATAQLKLYFGGNVTLNTGAINISTAFTAWRLKGYIIRTSSSTAHVTYELHAPGLATPVFVGYNNLTGLDFTTANILKITAQAGGAGGGTADITAHSWQVLYKPAP
jgi:hypothetical protein